jgi:putative transposase
MPTHYTQIPSAHYLTFGCYSHLWLFKDPTLYYGFTDHLQTIRQKLQFKLYGYVVMPNHVHLLLFPPTDHPDHGSNSISRILLALKGPYAYWALPQLERRWPELHRKLEVQQQGKLSYHFWQAGGGYDRNIFSDDEFIEKLNYMHLNPVRKGFVETAAEWRWSSAKYYETGEAGRIPIDKPVWR